MHRGHPIIGKEKRLGWLGGENTIRKYEVLFICYSVMAVAN